MNRTTLYIFLLGIVMLFVPSCKKEVVFSRDQLIGTWKQESYTKRDINHWPSVDLDASGYGNTTYSFSLDGVLVMIQSKYENSYLFSFDEKEKTLAITLQNGTIQTWTIDNLTDKELVMHRIGRTVGCSPDDYLFKKSFSRVQ